MDQELKKYVLKTIIFFDLFNYPLTEPEIWNFLYSPNKKYSFKEIHNFLQTLPSFLERKNGFYFLKNREKIINIRHKRYKESFNKFKKAKKAVKIFSLLPFIKMIAVGNYIPADNTKKNSDIDFFIITKKGRIWLARFFCATISKILGWRPTEKNKKDKICLTFFISEDNLNLKSIALDQDIYFYYWIATLYPLYNKDEIYEKFIKANDWIKRYLPNLDSSVIARNDIGATKQSRNNSVIARKSLSRRMAGKQSQGLQNKPRDCFSRQGGIAMTLDFLENLAKKFQFKIMPKNLKQLANKNTYVIINDKILKFHDQDRREEYRNRFLERGKKLL